MTCLFQRVQRHHRMDAAIQKPALLAMAAVGAQILLGVFTLVTDMAAWIATAHVVTGAFILGCLAFLTLRSFREVRA